MPKKAKIEQMRSPSKAAIRSRFEERILTVYGTEADKGEWIVRKDPSGTYVNPTIQERWLGFLLAYDKGPNALAIQEASPFVTRITRDMRALALELKSLAVVPPGEDVSRNQVVSPGSGAPYSTTAALLDRWADDIEARPDALFEDVYEQMVDMIDGQVSHSGARPGRPFPPSVVDTMRLLLEHFNATRATQDISPQYAGVPTIAEDVTPAGRQLPDLH
jgi:hypothetical protein